MKAKIFYGPAESGKTRKANEIMQQVGKDKTIYIDAKSMTRSRDYEKRSLYYGINENTQLIIFDDCPKNFQYTRFLVNLTSNSNGEIVFKVEIPQSGLPFKTYIVPQVIFTTEQKPEFRTGMSFIASSLARRFDLIQFPQTQSPIQL